MRVLLYSLNFNPELTGIGKYSGEMAEWFVSRGHDVRVISAPPYYPQWQVSKGYSAFFYKKQVITDIASNTSLSENKGCRGGEHGSLVVFRCPLWIPSRPSGLKRILHLASFAFSSFPVVMGHVLWRPDVVIVIEPPLFCSPTSVLTGYLARCKTLLHVQDFEVDAAFELDFIHNHYAQSLVLAMERWIMRRFDKISTISGRMLERLKIKGVDQEKLLFFPNWVNTALIYPMDNPSPFRAELGFSDNNVVLLYSGNMGQKQGLEVIIEAARLLEPHTNVRFVMCGQGAAYETLYAMAAGLQNMTWLPLQPLDRLNELLNLADIHLLPQKADAADLVMPSKLTGILASGRAVVATASKGTEVWSVVEGRGINTPPGDVEAFAEAIYALVNDPDERRRLGKQARRYAEDKLGADAVLGQFEQELLQITGSLE